MNHHGQNTWLVFLLFGSWGFGPLDDVGERGVLKNFRGGVAYVQKYLVKRPVFGVTIDEAAQLFGVAERSEGAVDQAHDLTQVDVAGISAQLVSTLGSAHAFNHASVLQFEQNQLEKLFRESLFVGDVADANSALVIVAGQHHHGLQRVETFLGDFHMFWHCAIKLYGNNRVY